jgi:hypothetical protein
MCAAYDSKHACKLPAGGQRAGICLVERRLCACYSNVQTVGTEVSHWRISCGAVCMSPAVVAGTSFGRCASAWACLRAAPSPACVSGSSGCKLLQRMRTQFTTAAAAAAPMHTAVRFTSTVLCLPSSCLLFNVLHAWSNHFHITGAMHIQCFMLCLVICYSTSHGLSLTRFVTHTF